MLRFLSLLTSVFVFASASAMEKGPSIPDYPADKISENIYVIHGPITTPDKKNQGFMNNPGIVLTSKGAVIIDPGGTLQSGEMVLRVVKILTDKPVVAVFNTHVHGDHWLGNQAVKQHYPKAPIYAHPNLIAEVAAGAGSDWVALMEQLTEGESRGTISVSADKAINHGDHITVGDTTFDIYHYGVAHTHTDIMIGVNKNAVLFMGDNLLNGRYGRTSDGNIKGVIDSSEKVISIKPVVIVPGHGQSGDLKMFNYALDSLRILYKTVAEQYEEGLSDFEMKPAVVESLHEYKHWEEFDDGLGKIISQAFLEIEATDF